MKQENMICPIWKVCIPVRKLAALAAAVLIFGFGGEAHAEWVASEKTETYPVSGTSGPELYESIGKKAPALAGNTRAIAHTRFKLTWSRKYKREGNDCVLASAHPNLTIFYTFPEPSQKLPRQVREKWTRFRAGLQRHERVHGDMIRDLVHQIEQATIGMSAADDPNCQKIKVALRSRLAVLSQARQQRSREFDRIEMGEDGPIRKLILDLVNAD